MVGGDRYLGWCVPLAAPMCLPERRLMQLFKSGVEDTRERGIPMSSAWGQGLDSAHAGGVEFHFT